MSGLRHSLLLAADAVRALPAGGRRQFRGPLLRLLRDSASGGVRPGELQADVDALLVRVAELRLKGPGEPPRG